MLRILALVITSLCAAAAAAQAPAPARSVPKPDPVALLAAAKGASGGSAWDALRTQRSEVKLAAAGLEGAVERLVDIATGRSHLRYNIGPLSGAAGYDGKAVWTQDGQDPPKVETGAAALELAANAAYRDKLAFWFADRGRARIEYKDRAQADGRAYDVVSITPEGGRTFEFWIDADTKLIERLVEREADLTRTEIYSDRREVQGVRIPFHTRTTRGDPKLDEVVTVSKIVFNESVATISFGPPADAQELSFPEGRAAVEVPFEVYSGHLFVNVLLDGRGPFRMLLDAGGVNVLSRQTAQALIGPRPLPQTQTMPVASTMMNGVELGGQRYVVADIDGFLRRVEGLDNIAGVLGLEWFVRMPVKLDFARSRLTLYDPDKFKYAGNGVRVPVAVRGRLPQVRGSIEGIEGLFEIDTGSRGSLTLASSFAAKHDLAKRLNAKAAAITGAGVAGPLRATLARGKSLKLGGVDVAPPVVAIPQDAADAAGRTEVAGNVGFGVLRQFALTYDLPNDALYFERYINFGTPDITDRGGLWLERVDEGYKVVDVVADGPAAAAGLKASDVIVEINGYPAAQTPLPAAREVLRQSPGSRVRMKTSTGSEVVVVLRDLV